MPQWFLGMLSYGPDEEIPTESIRDRDWRSSPNELVVDRIVARLADPALSTDERARLQRDLKERAHEVKPGSRATGRVLIVDGEVTHERTDDSDVTQPTGAREVFKR